MQFGSRFLIQNIPSIEILSKIDVPHSVAHDNQREMVQIPQKKRKKKRKERDCTSMFFLCGLILHLKKKKKKEKKLIIVEDLFFKTKIQ